MDMKNLKRILRNNRLTGKMYRALQTAVVTSQISYDIPEVQPISARFESKNEKHNLRLNILLPSIDVKHVFGGIATAITFFEELGKTTGADMRIIVTDSMVDINTSVQLEDYVVVTQDKSSEQKKQIVPYADRYNKSIPVHEADIFLATGWWTAYTIASVIEEQKKYYQKECNPLIYFIQDYEPGFYAWSSRYLMADSTYRLDIPTIAIFNSNLLRDYFQKSGYEFEKEYSFDPILNENLRKYLIEKQGTVPRKNQIIFYGRPTVQRNAFELVLAALKKWATTMEGSQDWEVLALGETFDKIALGNGKEIRAMGKLTLEEYGHVMLESKIAISLMVSPHPSYPPLEMSTFGVKTITNCYDNKNLDAFNENIISLQNCSDTAIANQLMELCTQDKLENQISLNEHYVENNNVFAGIIQSINDDLKKYQ